MKIDEFKLKGKTVEIHQDDLAESPRNWDNLGTMAFFHRRYNVGDELEFYSPEELSDFLADEDPIALAVRGYDHGGLTISAGNSLGLFRYPYNDSWDSGLLGYIYVTKERVRRDYGWKNLTKERIAKIESYLRSEVDIYDLYLQGRVYGYIATCDSCGEEDSCWGFYGEEWKENGVYEHTDYYCSCLERQYNQLVDIRE